MFDCGAREERLWGQIFILDFGQHRRDRAFQPARKNEDRTKLVPGNGNEVQLNRES